MRALSKISADWWDYTTLDRSILDAAARITLNDLKKLERPGFKINLYSTYQEFYCAEALEYVSCWQKATADVQRRGDGEREWGVTSQGVARVRMKRAASARRQGWAYPAATSHPPAGFTQSWYRVHEHVDTCRGGWRE